MPNSNTARTSQSEHSSHRLPSASRARHGSRAGLGCFAVVVAGLVACGSDSTDTPSSPAANATGSSNPSAPPPSIGGPAPELPSLVEGGECQPGRIEIRKIGTRSYEGKVYDIVIATPCEYVLPFVRKGVTYPIEETTTHYVVDSHFELPYIPGVMDTVVFTPGAKNKGWALGGDVEAIVAKYGPLPFLYHVRPGYDYGYYTDYADGGGDIFGAFRPTWRFEKSGGNVTMKLFTPPDPAWPRHRGGWNPTDINQQIGFGLFVDEKGKVYVPKGVPLGRQKFSGSPGCVVVNKATAAVPITRTQFPGDESYYLADTLLPGYASILTFGHLYWGHKGKKMQDVAKWDETLPGNFDKPFGGNCGEDGYSVAHAEGFTWPELRTKMRDKYRAGEIAAIPKENLYRVSVYEQKDENAPLELKGKLWYEWVGDEWLPRSEGPALISLDASRGTFRISGHLYEKQRAFVVIEDL